MMTTEDKRITTPVGYLQMNNRSSISLNGKWGFYADNMGAFGLKRSRNIFEGLCPTEEDRAVEYDVDAFDKISVPGDWNTQKKEYLLFEGFGWYARRIRLKATELSELRNQRVFLRLDGVNYAVEAWWNGEKVGEAELPFLPLAFELSPESIKDENLLVIKVDARRMAHRIPSERYDWFNYGGLIRGVRLVSTPSNFIAHASYHSTGILSKDGSAAVVDGVYTVELNLHSELEDSVLRWEIPELNFSKDFRVSKSSLKLPLKSLPVELWEVGQARLYASHLSLFRKGEEVDFIKQSIGFKQVTCRGTDLLVNGEPVFLKGIALHEERLGPNGGKPRNLAEIRELIDLAEGTGCNFLRLAHYPYDEAWLAECDRRGLLVWDEIPVYWEITYGDENTSKIIYESAQRMVEVSRGHACILCHALANETWERPHRKRVMRKAFRLIKKLDPKIPATAAFNAPYQGNTYEVEAVGHSIYEYVDVVGLNEYGGWYSPPMKELKKARIAVGSKPLFVTEFGAAGPLGEQGDPHKLWNLDSQQTVYTEQLKLFKRTKELSGWTPWALKDFRSTLRANGFQKGWNRKGLVGPKGEKKPVYDLVQNAFTRAKKK